MPKRFLFLTLSLPLLFGACQEDPLTLDSSAKLRFSTRDVFFDTLFKNLSSATQRLRVYNPNNQEVNISEIELMGGKNSIYRLNIDGRPTNQESNITLDSRDSLFIFAEMTIDQTKPSNPFIIKDSIRFETNGNNQFVKLRTYGRHAIIHKREVISSNTTWRSDTPHLIMDFAAVDSNTTLTIEKGTKIFNSGSANFFVFGTLNVTGTTDERVTFQGTRPEQSFMDRPGQWQGIRFLPSSKNNIINNAIIDEATVGIEVDSLSLNRNPKLILLNSRISNMARTGIAGFSSSILGINTIVSECCGNLVTGIFGGSYQFIHCTFMASDCQCSPEGPALGFNSQSFEGTDFTLNVTLLNSVIWGKQEDELTFGNIAEKDTIAVVKNVIKTSQDLPSGNKINKDPLFQGICNYNFKVNQNSPVIGEGASIGQFAKNLPWLQQGYYDEGRDTANPDIGAIVNNP